MYLLRRLLWFVPTLFAVSLLAFALNKMAPGDPVMLYTHGELDDSESSAARYEEVARQLGMDKPNFYFQVSSAALPDTLHRILRQDRRIAAEKISLQTGNWDATQRYLRAVQLFEQYILENKDRIGREHFLPLRKATLQLFIQHKKNNIESYLQIVENETSKIVDNLHEVAFFQNIKTAYQQLWSQTTLYKRWIPTVYWVGLDNQYHNYISNFVTGNFGVSYEDNRPVAAKIADYGRWTLLLNLLAILFTYAIAVPLGVWSAAQKGTKKEAFLQGFLAALYAMPTFWVASLLLLFFTTSDYGLRIFPSAGLGNYNRNVFFFKQFLEVFPHLVMPLICLIYNNLAFVARQMRRSTLDALSQDFVRTARAKGLLPKTVLWQHAVRNALFPLVTMLASLLPASLAGSIVIEYIFNLPGLGGLLQKAVAIKDWNIVFAIMMLGAVLMLVGILIADLLYSKIDPRVTFSKK